MSREQPMGPIVSRRARRQARYFIEDSVAPLIATFVAVFAVGIAFGWSTAQVIVVTIVGAVIATLVRRWAS